MFISERKDNAVHVLSIEGRIDSTSARSLEDVLLPRVETHSNVVVDLNHVSYVSSAGLRIFLMAARIATKGRHRFVLAGLRPAVSEVFEITGFLGLFKVQPNLAAALERLEEQ